MAQADRRESTNDPARVAVTAAGVISPFGFGLAETLESLRSARDCVTPVMRFAVTQCRCKTAGQVSDWRLLASYGQIPRSRRLHRASHMMIQALQELVTQQPEFEPELTVVGTTSGGMSYGERYYRSLNGTGDLRHAPNAIGHAFECVRSGRYRRVLAGGYDALAEMVFVGFDSLQASTPEKCRPFDRHRSGMVLGEGAAVLALENLDSARARGASVLAEIIGYGISTDNFHITQPEPSGIGARQAMERALESAHVSAADIDYINAHGTATVFNDAAEGKAISALFNGVPVSSTKSMMGHSLGAAGSIEAVVCLLALQHQFLPANINFTTPDDGVDLNIVGNEPRSAVVDVALSNSFGFGGTNASVLMRKLEA